MVETETITNPEQKESIKLTKNTKGYGWELKIIDPILTSISLERLNKLNEEMIAKYGQVD